MEICNETQYLAAAQSIFEHAHLPVLVCDKKMLILWHNSCAEVYIHGLTGYPSAAGLLPTGDLGSILAQLQKGLDVYLPSPQLPAGGSPLQLHLIPVLGAQGQLQLVTLMLPVASSSLTEGSRRQIDRVSTAFSAASRTNLTAIFSALSPLARKFEEYADYEGQKMLDQINRSAYRLLRLGKNIEQASQLLTGAYQLQLRPVEMARLLQDLCQGAATVLRQSPVPLTYQIDFKQLFMLIDQQLLVGCITNLLSNAFLYSSDQNTVHLHAQVVRDALHISVRDRGAGIPAEVLHRVFDPYYSYRDPELGFVQAAGLGLTICRQAVQAMGGQIFLTSTPGDGTTVRFSLPITPPQPGLSSPAAEDFIGNRYSSLYVDLADVCTFPYL